MEVEDACSPSGSKAAWQALDRADAAQMLGWSTEKAPRRPRPRQAPAGRRRNDQSQSGYGAQSQSLEAPPHSPVL